MGSPDNREHLVLSTRFFHGCCRREAGLAEPREGSRQGVIPNCRQNTGRLSPGQVTETPMSYKQEDFQNQPDWKSTTRH